MNTLRDAEKAVINENHTYGYASLETLNKLEQAVADADANPCKTHPMAPHGFLRQASHANDRYVCECEAWDPYDAGYQDGMRAAWDANGTLLPDGWVLVPEVATEQIIKAIIERGNQHGDDISYDTAVLIWNDATYAAAPEVSNEP